MATTRDKYIAPLVSERWLRPYTTCTIISTLTALLYTHLGEMDTWPSGRKYGKSALKSLVNRAWKAIDPDKDRHGYGRQHLNGMFDAWGVGYRYNRANVSYTRERPDIVESLKKGFVIVMAGNVRGCRANSPLRRYVNEVDHRMAFVDTRLKNGQRQVRVIDPMTPEGKPHARWVPVQDMFDFGKRFKHFNRFFCERYRKGSDTREAKARRQMGTIIETQQERINNIKQEFAQAEREAAEVITRLEADVAALEYELSLSPDRPAALVAAQRIRELADKVIEEADEVTEAMRVEPLAEP